MAPIISILSSKKLMSSVMHHQTEVIASGLMFAKKAAILPAPEAAHAIKAAADKG